MILEQPFVTLRLSFVASCFTSDSQFRELYVISRSIFLLRPLSKEKLDLLQVDLSQVLMHEVAQRPSKPRSLEVF